jgi:hypothetical protein
MVAVEEAQFESDERLTHPVPDVEEALLIGQVEEQQEAHGVPEEGRGQTPKPEEKQTDGKTSEGRLEWEIPGYR